MKPLRPHEKRKYPRIEAKIQVAFRSVAELIQEYTRNISSGGIFLKTDQPLDPNAVIDLTVQFPEKLGTFQVQGKVVRLMVMSDPAKAGGQLFGAGIRFVNPSAEMLMVIETLVTRTSQQKAVGK